jgi:hypothetical protein
MRRMLCAALIIGVVSMAACDPGADGVDYRVDVDEMDLDAPVGVTVIEFGADGVIRHERMQTTRRIQRAEAELEAMELAGDQDGIAAARQAMNVVQADPPNSQCPTTYFRMWHEPNYVGEMICFNGTQGIAELDDYVWDDGPFNVQWGGRVESLKPGSYTGRFNASCASCDLLDSNDASYVGPSETFWFRYGCNPC